MALRLYNTLTRRIEDFQPLTSGRVTMYVCGPTVYDDPHIGHARSAFVFDVLRRYLKHRGLAVTFVRNVTDVDDKIIQKARETSEAVEVVTARYLRSYHAMLERLGILPPDVEPLATGHIDAMIELIAQLLVKEAAYEAQGDVYFAVRKFERYGRLSNRTLDELQAGARVEPGEHKRDPLDFALWKAAKPGEPSWPSPWGAGRPGWHIECSAMSVKYLGDAFDIHGGGVDLVFPHHENEIAQAQAAGKPFAKYWIHNGLLTVNGEKMSKSLGNFITLERALKDCQHPRKRGGEEDVLKMFFLGTHYRSPIDYTTSNVDAAGGRLDRWMNVIERAEQRRSKSIIPVEPPSDIEKAKRAFIEAMDDDLNTPQALAAIDQLAVAAFAWESKLALVEKKSPMDIPPLSPEPAVVWGNIVAISDAIVRLAQLLGLSCRTPEEELTSEQYQLVQQREAARKRGDFKAADQIRQQLALEEIMLEDTPHGTIWRRKR